MPVRKQGTVRMKYWHTVKLMYLVCID